MGERCVRCGTVLSLRYPASNPVPAGWEDMGFMFVSHQCSTTRTNPVPVVPETGTDRP